MTFRKNTWSFRFNQILCLICLTGALWTATKVYPDFAACMPLMGISVGMVILLVFNPWNQMLQIDDGGIRCFRRGRTLWTLPWGEIEKIRQVTVYGCRGYAITPKNTMKWDLQRTRPQTEYTFEHTPGIRAALELYAPQLVEKRR